MRSKGTMVEESEGKKIENLVNLAKYYIDTKNYSKALQNLELAVNSRLGDRKVWFLLGEANRFLGQDNNALDAYRKANEISEEGDTYFKMGYINQYKFKKYTEALEFYTKTVELDPSAKGAWLNMGVIYDKLKNFDKALMCNEECLKIDPNYALAYNNIGWLYKILKKDKKKAISYFEKAIEVDPKSVVARKSLLPHKSTKKETAVDWNCEGDAYFEMKNYKAALKCFKKATELNPKEYLYWYDVGKSYHRLRKYKDAIKYYEKANAISPAFDTLLDMGLAYRNIKKYDKAIDCYKKADEIRPGNHILINNVGDIYFKQRNFHFALDYFERTIKANPGYALGWYNVGITCKKLGEYYKAIYNWSKALAIDPNHRLTKKAFGTLLRERPYLKDDIIAVAEGKFDSYLK